MTEMLVGVQVANTGGVSIGGGRVAPLTTTEPESVVPLPTWPVHRPSELELAIMIALFYVNTTSTT